MPWEVSEASGGRGGSSDAAVRMAKHLRQLGRQAPEGTQWEVKLTLDGGVLLLQVLHPFTW